MARPAKERKPASAASSSGPARRNRPLEPVPSVVPGLNADQVCNDPIPYERTIDIAFGDASDGTCSWPSPTQEGKALEDAKQNLNMVAEGYCRQSRTCGSQKQCMPVVTIESIVNLGVVVVPEMGKKRCALKFKIGAKIACFCVSI